MADQLNNGAGPFSARCHTALSGSDVVAFKSASGLATELRELAHIRDQAQSLTDGDIIYCQRTVYKRLRALYLLMKATSWPMVFDFDDSIFLHKPHIIRWFLGRADVVVTANSFLQKFAEYYSDSVYRIPTSIPSGPYTDTQYRAKQSDEFVIGWVGNANAHTDNLKDFAQTARAIGERVPDITIHLVGVMDTPEIKEIYDGIDEIDTQFTDWIDSDSYECEVGEVMASFDAAILPMEDTFWNRGKTPVKLLQYMAVGVPTIGSPVGAVEEIIVDGETGFHASVQKEWVEAVRSLQSTQHRERMSESSKKRFNQNHTVEAAATELKSLLLTEFPC